MKSAPARSWRQQRLDDLTKHPDFGSKAELGRALGMKSGGAYIRQMIDGERPITEKFIEKCDELRGGKYRGWFRQRAGTGDDPQAHPLSDHTPDALPFNNTENVMRRDEALPGYVRLPVLAEAAAGPGRMSDGQELIEHVDVAEDWVRRTLRANPANVRVVTARGHSMTGLIEDGDAMFVEPVERFVDDGVYVIAIGDLLRVKRLKLKLNGLVSIESNDGSEPDIMTKAEANETLQICAQVKGVWTLRRM